MQPILQIEEIDKRIARLRLPPKVLANMAGVNFGTYYRARQQPGSTLRRNLHRLTEAVVSEELALRDYLLALHPVGPSPAATRDVQPSSPAGEEANEKLEAAE
jgi:hypothetical protein